MHEFFDRKGGKRKTFLRDRRETEKKVDEESQKIIFIVIEIDIIMR